MAARFNYPRTRATAERLIARFGQSATIIRVGMPSSGGAPEPEDEPWNNPDPAPVGGEETVDREDPCTLVETEYSSREVDGSLVRMTDRRLLVSTRGLEEPPALSDRVRIGGRTLEVVTVKPVSPGGVVLLWEVQGR